MFSQAAVVEQLRERIQRLQASPRRNLTVLRTGLAPLDALLPAGGFILGQAIELWGESASGRTTLVLRAIAAAHRERRLCAYVDGPNQLYPPAAAALGVDLRRLLWVHAPSPSLLVWAAVQLLRSGTFAGVALDLTGTGLRLTFAQGKKLTDAAAQGGSVLWTLTPPEAPGEGMTRLHAQAEVDGLTLEVVRGRQGRQGQRVQVPWEALMPLPPGPMLPVPGWGTSSIRSSLYANDASTSSPRARPAKKTDLRNGPSGIIGQRPGRDTAMPALRPVLGLEEETRPGRSELSQTLVRSEGRGLPRPERVPAGSGPRRSTKAR